MAMTAGELLDARSDRANTRQPRELICLIKIAQSASHPQGPPQVDSRHRRMSQMRKQRSFAAGGTGSNQP